MESKELWILRSSLLGIDAVFFTTAYKDWGKDRTHFYILRASKSGERKLYLGSSKNYKAQNTRKGRSGGKNIDMADTVGSWPEISQILDRKIRRSTFLNYITFAHHRIWRLYYCQMLWSGCPTGLFIILEPDVMEIGELYFIQKHRATDFEATKRDCKMWIHSETEILMRGDGCQVSFLSAFIVYTTSREMKSKWAHLKESRLGIREVRFFLFLWLFCSLLYRPLLLCKSNFKCYLI